MPTAPAAGGRCRWPTCPSGRSTARAGAEPELWRAVRGLPEKQRAAVFLRFAGDLDYSAIGAAIGCTEPAARQNVRAGLMTIRKGWVT